MNVNDGTVLTVLVDPDVVINSAINSAINATINIILLAIVTRWDIAIHNEAKTRQREHPANYITLSRTSLASFILSGIFVMLIIYVAGAWEFSMYLLLAMFYSRFINYYNSVAPPHCAISHNDVEFLHSEAKNDCLGNKIGQP